MHRRIRAGFIVALCAMTLIGAAPASATPTPHARATSTLIAFDTRYSARVSQIFTIRPDGSHRRQLTRSTNGAWDPTFSPDGSDIAYVRDGPNGSVIVLMHADGSERHRVGPDPGHDHYAPTWTPDGAQIVFVRCEQGPGYPCRIARMDADGSNIVELTNGRWHDGGGPFGQFLGETSPIVSPDGGSVAFTSDRGGFDGRMFVMGSDGSNLHAVTKPAIEAGASSWSPDGDWIAVTADPALGSTFLLHPDGSEMHRVQPDTLWPSFSPSGRRLLAVHASTGSLVTFPIDGGRMRVVPNTAGATLSDWGPVA